MESLRLVLHSGLFKLLIGVLLAFGVRMWMKRDGHPTHQDMVDELRTLLPPAFMVGVGFLATNENWMGAVEAFLLAIAVPLGINSKGNGENKDEG